MAAESQDQDMDVEKGLDSVRSLQFRVAVNVYEARKLEGMGKNPTIKVAVKCDSKVKKTKSKKGSMSPEFNELIVFNLECTPLVLMDKVLEFRVVTQSLKERLDITNKDAGLVGSYKMDLGMVYKQIPHLYRSKWLILSDSKCFGEVKGYLRVSIQITGPGEVPQDLPLVLSGVEARDDDIKNNLIIPAGVSLIPGILTIRIFKAEHLPQMDPKRLHSKGSTTNLVDPYCVVRYAEYEAETDYVKKSCNPSWNTEIGIPTYFPSMCDRIRFHVMDKDTAGSDSYIGTVYINLSHISEHGKEGFPPTFGPCYVNLYGTTREYEYSSGKDDPNKGKVEGVAYRGRILVEITSTLDGTLPDNKMIKQKIDQSLAGSRTELDANFGGYHQNYKLFAVLLSANMVYPHDDFVQFEVSIGTTGYQLTSDESGTLGSRTPPTPRPMEGHPQNHYMPWLDKKPCIELDVKLEDCCHRIQSLNILLRIAEKLNKELANIKKLLESHDEHEYAVDKLKTFLPNFGSILEQELPFSDSANSLDERMRELQNRELNLLKDDIFQMEKDLFDGNGEASAILEKLADHVSRIKILCVEPQNSIPDVIIWMLCGNKRVAVKRIPSHDIMYSHHSPDSKGKRCGKVQIVNLEPPPVVDEAKSSSITKQRKGAQVSLVLWLGPEDSFKQQTSEIEKYFTAEYCKATEKKATLQRYLALKNRHTFQLRAYLYQAKNLFRGDDSGLSDPYAIVTFGNYSGTSVTIEKTLSPFWNQTVLVENVELYGDVGEEGSISNLQNIKCVTVQIWDKDIGRDEFLGEARGKPIVQLGPPQKVELEWLVLRRQGEAVGEALAAFELVLSEGERKATFHEVKLGEHHQIMVPEDIAPRTELHTIEFRLWGIRDMKKLGAIGISSPVVELECEGKKLITSGSLSNASKNQNFPTRMSLLTANKEIPVGRFLPSVTIKVYDKRLFRRMPLVGSHVIKSVKPYVVSTEERSMKTKDSHSIVAIPEFIKPFKFEKPPADYEMEILYDWWSKYFSSQDGKEAWVQSGYAEPEANMDKLRIYHNELEKNFRDGLEDFLQTFPLHRGKGSSHDPEDHVGCVKGAIRLYPTVSPDVYGTVLSEFSTEPVDVLVRVYIVEAFNLTPQDIITGSSDPYLEVSIGKTKLDSKESKLTNDLNPTFGKMFELSATLPTDHTLTVTVMDYDRGSRDDMIGTTTIDLETRFYTTHRAACGLPQTISVYGINKWRDRLSPVEILYDWVKREGLPDPVWSSNEGDNPQVKIGKDCYNLSDLDQGGQPTEKCPDPFQRLALLILHDIDRKHEEKHHEPFFVPEHVETRTLYHPMQPRIAQGSLRMWVDVFDKNCRIPPPVCISRREPEEFELRVIVWNTTDVEFQEVSFVTKEPMTDIYVKGRFGADSQKTDVHYRSLDGTGNFNWRFIFPFKYIVAENRVVIEEKEHFWHFDKTRRREEPKLTIEIWDDDAFSRDDFIGSLDFNLTEMQASLRQSKLPAASHPHTCNLFTTKRMKGWWEVKSVERNPRVTGKVQLEFELLKRNDAEKKPAGKGRSEPNMNPFLHKPERPESSFFWLLSPLKTFKLIIWRRYKWIIIGIIVLIIAIAIIVGLL